MTFAAGQGMPLMDVRSQSIASPYFSICVPQYNRTSYLLEAIRVLAAQDFRDFEVCIADDCSPDGRGQEVVDLLRSEGLSFAYRRNTKNLRYDGNLRAAIELATGRYCILHGNDDCLKDSHSLTRLHELLEEHGRPAVAVTNFEDWDSGQVTRRLPCTRLYSGGPETAAMRFRNVSFVTGVILDRALAQTHQTELWDGSEMYQMFLMARLITLGGTMLEIDESLVRRCIQIPGESIETHEQLPKVKPCPIVPRLLPMVKIGRTVADGIRPGVKSREEARRLNEQIFKQLYTYSLPRWVVEFRRVQSWKYALGIALGQSPRYVCEGVDLSLAAKARLTALHTIGSSLGLIVPWHLYASLHPWLHALAKRR